MFSEISTKKRISWKTDEYLISTALINRKTMNKILWKSFIIISIEIINSFFSKGDVLAPAQVFGHMSIKKDNDIFFHGGELLLCNLLAKS